MLREGARRYRELLALPCARRPVIASSFGSLPIGLFGLATLLLVDGSTGSFASAGRVVGAFGLGNAFGAVAQGRLMDRLGQTRVLRTVAVATSPPAPRSSSPPRRTRPAPSCSPAPPQEGSRCRSCRRRCSRCRARW